MVINVRKKSGVKRGGKMLSDEAMVNHIIEVAKNDDQVRLVMLNGSRVNPQAKVDLCSDYDIVFFVKNYNEAIKKDYSKKFNDIMLLHTSDDMVYLKDDRKEVFIFQMLFADKHRLDLSLRPIERLNHYIETEPVYKVLFDKDAVSIPKLQQKVSQYIVKKPSFKLFESCVKTFVWLEPYVAKGLYRNEPIYALKHITLLREAFETMLKWKMGVQTDFGKIMGKAMKHMRYYLGEETYNMYLKTYCSGDLKTIWNTLFFIHDKFLKTAQSVGKDLGYEVDFTSFDAMRKYLREIKGLAMSNKPYNDFESMVG